MRAGPTRARRRATSRPHARRRHGCGDKDCAVLPRAFAGVAVIVAICAVSVVDASASGSAAATQAQPVPAPTVTGPIAGRPASLSAVDLGPRGYVEEEFFVEGTARSYDPVGPLAQDGRWNVQPTTTAPYRTRALARRPKDRAKING